MMIHLDTSVLVDAFAGQRRSLSALRAATAAGDVAVLSAVVLYEWRRGPRTEDESAAVDTFFGDEALQAFGRREAECAAALYRQVRSARRRQADLVIAACAIEHGAQLWTLNRTDFDDIPGLVLYHPPP
jgi:predicted nucleic acid-binding protein